MQFTKPVSKYKLSEELGITARTLSDLLNKKYFKQLSAAGYSRHQKQLSPKQLNILMDLYGISPEDFITVKKGI